MKTRKAFAKFDLMLYAVLVFLVVLLFLFFVILPKNQTSDGFKVIAYEKQVFCFYYSDKSYTISPDADITVENADGVYTITVKLGEGFNVLQADTVNKTVKVIDANCSLHKDCVYTPALTGNNGGIVCVPHSLQILPITSGVTPPIVG